MADMARWCRGKGLSLRADVLDGHRFKRINKSGLVPHIGGQVR